MKVARTGATVVTCLVSLGILVPCASAEALEIGAVSEIHAGEIPSSLAAGGYTVQAAQAAGTYAVPPGYAAITAWSHSTGTAAGALAFKVYRPTGAPKEYVVVGSDTRHVTPRTVETYAVRIGVLPGDRIGLSSEDVQLAYETNNDADKVGFFGLDLPPGATRATDGEPFEGFKLDVMATLEPEPASTGPAPPPPSPSAPPTPPAAVRTPVVSQLRLAPAVFSAARTGPSTAAAAGPASGTRLSYRLNIAADVRFVVRRTRPGRRSGSGATARCVAPTKRNRTAASCTRHIPLPGGFTKAAKAGANSLYFTGRVGGRRLPRGTYTLVATPRADGKTGTAASRSFVIKRWR